MLSSPIKMDGYVSWVQEFLPRAEERDIRRENNKINMGENRKVKEYETELNNAVISHVILKLYLGLLIL